MEDGEAKDWLAGQGLDQRQMAAIAAVLRARQVTPNDWLRTLHGIDKAELLEAAGPPGDGDKNLAGASPAPKSEPDDPPEGKEGACAGDRGSEQEAEETGAKLTSQLSAGTEDFLSYGRREAEKRERRQKLYRQRFEAYGADTVTIGRRRTMEDVMMVHGCFRGRPDEDLFAVFDGHGGQSVANYAAMHMSAAYQHAFESQGCNGENQLKSSEQLGQASMSAFRWLNSQLVDALQDDAYESGCTAVVALVVGRQLHVANCGDSRAVLCRGGGVTVRLSFDHKPSEPGERARIEALGGTVLTMHNVARLDGTLAVCRSFGDLGYAPKLTVDPYTNTVELVTASNASAVVDAVDANANLPDPNVVDGDQFIILACDGIWDVVSDEDAAEIVGRIIRRGGTVELASQRLRDEALQRNSSDNISVLVVLLSPLPQSETEVIGFFSTTHVGKLGITFGDQWPVIKEIKTGSLAASQPQIEVGMKLVAINGQQAAGMEFKEAAQLVKRRPLELLFERQHCQQAAASSSDQ